MKFTVEIPHRDFLHAGCWGVNRQTIAKFMREELQSCGGHFSPDDWQWHVLRNAKVVAEKGNR